MVVWNRLHFLVLKVQKHFCVSRQREYGLEIYYGPEVIRRGLLCLCCRWQGRWLG